MFAAFFCGSGSGLMLINQASLMAKARLGPLPGLSLAARTALFRQRGALLVVAIGISNCLGRMAAGLLAERLRPSRVTPPLIFAAFLVLMSGACASMALFPSAFGGLVLGCALGCAAYGAFWCILPIMVMDLFGTANFASNYSLVNLAPAVGSVAFNSGLAARVYAAHTPAGNRDCFGPGCYGETLLACAAACAVGALAAAGVAARNRGFYDDKRKRYLASRDALCRLVL
jgi:MFS family permease